MDRRAGRSTREAPMRSRLVLGTAIIVVAAIAAFSSGSRPTLSQDGAENLQPSVTPTPLVLALEGGERRLRRASVSAPAFILKVDRQNGGSPDLVVGYEDVPPGGSIPAHRHVVADEVIFVHRGSGVVQLNDTETAFEEGATIYIPRQVRVSLRNTGDGPLSILFIFSRPGFEEYLRESSVREGEPFVPLSREELAEIRRRHEWHSVMENP